MKDLKDLDDRMVEDTKNDMLTGATVEDMKTPQGPGRHRHEEGLEDAVVGGVAEDIIEDAKKWKYWIILPNIMKNNKYCIHNNNNRLGIPILI